MRVLLIAMALAAAGCASNARVATLETRLARLEAAQAKSDFEVRAAIGRLEATLESLAGAVGQLGDAEAHVERMQELAEDLEEQLAAAKRLPPAPAARPQRRAPAPDRTYGVAVAGSPAKGKADALVTIVRAGEYACPFCERVRPTLDQLLAAYPNDVRIVYKHFVVHPQVAFAPAYAACAAQRQGKFWEMDQLLWDKAFANRQFEPAQLEALALSLGLDMPRYRADVATACPKLVQDDMSQLTKFGVGATPVFFVNGRFLSGAQPFEAFQKLVDEELGKARAAVKKGTKKSKYYEQVIVKQGLPQLEPAPATP